MPLYREQAVVLRTYKLGETDRILHLLTSGRGKVRAVAKGVRRPGSRFGGRLEPFSHVDLQLYEGRSLDVVSQAELIAPFSGVREEYTSSACGSVVVEAADRVAQEDERALRLYLLVLDTLRALQTRPAAPELVLDGFLFRLADLEGYGAGLDACVSCGSPGPHAVLSIAEGGMLCGACAPAGSTPLSDEVVAALRSLHAAPLADLGALQCSGRARRATGALAHSYLAYHLGAPLRAVDLVPR